MLMLTHTYLLQKFMGDMDTKNDDLDIYIYNIAPDLLTIHPNINANTTHKIKRFIQPPPEYSRSAYVMFHLLVDDLAHYGALSLDCKEEFDPDSEGYSYVRGRPLIAPILELHRTIQKDISYNEAVYRSHLIIEMLYDLVILSQINTDKTIELLAKSIHFTSQNKIDEFAGTMNWLYGIGKDDVREVLKNASLYITQERMESIMNIEGRIHLFTKKFGLQNSDQNFEEKIKSLFRQAMSSLRDDETFLQQTAQKIKKYGWLPPLK